jgi:hypothetical protein
MRVSIALLAAALLWAPALLAQTDSGAWELIAQTKPRTNKNAARVYVASDSIRFYDDDCGSDFYEYKTCHWASIWMKIVEKSGAYRMSLWKLNREKECSYLGADKFYNKHGELRYADNPYPGCKPDEPDSFGNILHVMLFQPERDWKALLK